MIGSSDNIIMFSAFGVPVNATIFYTWVVMGILVALSIAATRNLSNGLKASRLQTIMEMIVMAIRNESIAISGDNPWKFIPLMGTLFLFIAMCNLLTVVPFWYQVPTASLSTTTAFAGVIFFAIPVYSIINGGVMGYIKKFIDPAPLLLPLNVLSDFSSTLAMAFRLFGNAFSGVMIGSVTLMLAPFLLPLPFTLLGLLTGTIQAYIFALLSVVYTTQVQPKKSFIDTLNYN